MADALFTGSIAAAKRPFRARELLGAEIVTLGVDDDGFALLITRSAVRSVRVGVLRSAPRETFGLLMGRTFEDGQGRYTLVSGVVESPGHSASVGHVTLSATQMRCLHERAFAEHPGADPVGWWHSHRSGSGYSQTDRDEQATWPGEDHVGLLAFMAAPDVLHASRGPRARRLRSAASAIEPLFRPTAPVSRKASRVVVDPERRLSRASGRGISPPRNRHAAVIAAVVALIVLALGGLRVQIAGLEAGVDGLSDRLDSLPTVRAAAPTDDRSPRPAEEPRTPRTGP